RGPGREGLAHIAAAAERDGAHVSAHDEALRTRFEDLPSPELARLRQELRSEVGAEELGDRRRRNLDDRIAHSEDLVARVEAERRELGDEPRRGRRARAEYRESVAHLDTQEARSREALARHLEEREELPPVAHEARAEVAAIDSVLAGRERVALAAARVAPADYLVAELGERPEDGSGRAAWDRAVREVEGFRQRHGLQDRDTALGPEADDHATRREQERVRGSIGLAQQALGIERGRTTERTRTMEIEL
ncbi:MAG: hypothetical protein JSR24_24315, partial [Proteobacteria bacterium]|nr:hypothetical protein [Pseudomonadota bacterium]